MVINLPVRSYDYVQPQTLEREEIDLSNLC